MELSTDVFNSLTKYFSSLEHFGYKSYGEVYKLLVYIFIEEMLHGSMSEFITDDDYDIINNSLYCLYGSCMIPYPDYKKGIEHMRTNNYDGYRFTEDDVPRILETNNIRVL